MSVAAVRDRIQKVRSRLVSVSMTRRPFQRAAISNSGWIFVRRSQLPTRGDYVSPSLLTTFSKATRTRR